MQKNNKELTNVLNSLNNLKLKDETLYQSNNNIILFDIKEIENDILINNNFFFVFIDTERTNANYLDDNSFDDLECNAIYQIGFKILGTNKTYKSYCKPDDNIPWRDHVICKKQLVHHAPELKYVLINFINFIEQIKYIPVFISHNHTYDKKILKYCLEYYNIKFNIPCWCNTMESSFFNINDKKIKSLEKIIEYLEVEKNVEMHDAGNDVDYLYKCLLKVHKNNENISNIILKYMNKHKLIKNYQDINIDGKIIKLYKNGGTEIYENINEKYIIYKNKKYKSKTNTIITETGFYKIKEKNKEYIKKSYFERYIHKEKRMYRIIEYLNINNDDFIITSGILPYEILKLNNKEYKNIMEMIYNEYGFINRYQLKDI